jgi:hypothetical protein
MRYGARVVAVAIALVALPALAEEVIHFKNGSSLAIRGHKVTEGMIHVDMGDDAFIGFPMSVVERIESAGKDVYVPPSSEEGLKRNQMIEGATTSDTPRRVTTSYKRINDSADRDYSQGRREESRVQVDENGMAYIPAFPGATGARGKMRITGRDTGGAVNYDQSRGLIGTRRLGRSQILGEEGADQTKRGVTLVRPSLSPSGPLKPHVPVEIPEQGGLDEEPQVGDEPIDDGGGGEPSGEQ